MFDKLTFDRLYNLDITDLIDKDYKGLKYLSWATAWKLLLDQDINAEYEVLKDNYNMPYFSRDGVHFVYTRIKAFEVTKEMYLPVMDNNHKAVLTPNSTQVNNTIQRCLAKNVAMFGLGLKLYVGEDLEEVLTQHQTQKNVPSTSFNSGKSINTPLTKQSTVKNDLTPLHPLTDLQQKMIDEAKKYKLTKDEFIEILGNAGFTSSKEVKEKNIESLMLDIKEYAELKGECK